MTKKLFLGFLALSLALLSTAFAEDLTITTYYPSPYGSYNELSVNKMNVGIGPQFGVESFVGRNSDPNPSTNPADSDIPPGSIYYNTSGSGSFRYKNDNNVWSNLGQNIKVGTGVLPIGGRIPIPAGYVASQCQWIISTARDPGRNDADIFELNLYDVNRVVHLDECHAGNDGDCSVWNSGAQYNGSVRYLIICGAN